MTGVGCLIATVAYIGCALSWLPRGPAGPVFSPEKREGLHAGVENSRRDVELFEISFNTGTTIEQRATVELRKIDECVFLCKQGLRQALQYGGSVILLQAWPAACLHSVKALIVKQGVEVTSAGKGELNAVRGKQPWCSIFRTFFPSVSWQTLALRF